jgi:hypothetical protein
MGHESSGVRELPLLEHRWKLIAYREVCDSLQTVDDHGVRQDEDCSSAAGRGRVIKIVGTSNAQGLKQCKTSRLHVSSAIG